MNRTTVIIVSIAAAVLIIGAIAFFLFYRSTATAPGEAPSTSIFGRLPLIGGRVGPSAPPETGAQPTSEIGRPIPEIATRRALQLTDEAVIGLAFDAKSQKILYYKKGDGHLVSNSLDGGKEETISNLTILNIMDVAWSPDKKKAVILYQDGDEIKKFITEATSTPKVVFLPKEAVAPVWSPDGKSIWWLAKQNKTYTLVSSDSSGKNQRKRGLTTLIPELGLTVVTADVVMLVPKTVSFFETPLFLFSLKTSVLNPFLSGFGLLTLHDANPKVQNVAYTITSRVGTLDNLHLLDIKNGKDTSWPLKTIATKCAFSPDSKFLFCAVPKEPPENGLPESWFEGKTSFADSIYRIDLADGKAEEVFHEGDSDVTDLVTSDDAKRLFFIDKKTGFLYGLSLE